MKLFGIDIPHGWTFEQIGPDSALGTHTDEHGSVETAVHLLFDGVMLERIRLSTPQLENFPLGASQLTCINYCTSGSCECDMGDQGSVMVGEGALCVSSTSPALSAYPTKFTYPQGHYTGFEFWLRFQTNIGAPNGILDNFGISFDALEAAWCAGVPATVVRPEGKALALCETINALLEEDVPNMGELRLATCNLLACLQNMQPQQHRETVAYVQRSQREMARAVHDSIQRNPAESFDVAAAAQGFGVSASALRGYFQRVYGQSPAAFARDAVMQAACKTLATTNAPVSDVALAAGYSNPSKFSAAFKRHVGTNPLEYRRRQNIH